MKKRILITCPIADFGGREVEVSLLSEIFSNHDVKVLSTGNMSENSNAIYSNVIWTSLKKKALSNKIIFFLTTLIKFFHFKNNDNQYYLKNRLFKKLINIKKYYKKALIAEIKDVDIILFCGQFSSDYLSFLIDECNENNIKLIIRITGTINEIPNYIKEKNNFIDKVIFHSKENSRLYSSLGFTNFCIIDQTILNKTKMNQLPINSSNKLSFGYLGRLTSEKGVRELNEFLKKLNLNLIMAGEGYLLPEILENNLICYIGALKSDSVFSFYSNIDVLIIPSFEESGPLVAMEAAAAGKLLLSTNVGAMKSRFGHSRGVFWFDINNFNTFIKSIEHIKSLTSAELIEYSKENRKIFNRDYSFEKIKQKYNSII